jgi:hypothetical protein
VEWQLLNVYTWTGLTGLIRFIIKPD